MMIGKDVAPTAITVLKFRPNPNKITAYCKTFLEVNVIPLFKISFSRTNFDNSIPSKMAKNRTANDFKILLPKNKAGNGLRRNKEILLESGL